jgi:hypothetical protein
VDLGWGAAKRSCRCYLCVGSAATARCEQQPARQDVGAHTRRPPARAVEAPVPPPLRLLAPVPLF